MQLGDTIQDRENGSKSDRDRARERERERERERKRDQIEQKLFNRKYNF
jgi:hypothetical protein